jgi:tetraacyldisaccharide 4'-kinase
MPGYIKNNSIRLGAWLQQQWVGLGFWHVLLIPLSWLFWLLSGLRRLCYKVGIFKSYKLPVPVIVVGNISIGGTGKTPLVIWLVERLKQHGFNPAIISRGYGGNADGPLSVNALSDPGEVGDEPVLLARRGECPVWIGQDRVAAAQGLLNAHPECDIIISDDGLQHYALQRDFEFVVMDGNRGFGNGWLLPAGPLRERISRLKTIDAVVCNGGRSPRDAYSMRLEAERFHNLNDPQKTAVAGDFVGKALYAVAGIGDPSRFFEQLKKSGLVFESRAFTDHHIFQASDLHKANVDVILMTEKDAVKCTGFAEENWWYLPVNAVVDEALFARIKCKFGQN